MAEQCRACQGQGEHLAHGTVLADVQVTYERCTSCGMVMATNPTWLDRAYTEAIAGMDIGLLDRCLVLSNVTAALLRVERLRAGRFLDWAGGYGTLTRLMRDRGYDFEHYDPMAKNVFAGAHGVPNLDNSRMYDLVTAFEVLEHLENPAQALEGIARQTNFMLVSTLVLPDPTPLPGDWWYYTPESGQHITFYTPRSIEELSMRLGFSGAVSGSFLHLLYKEPIRLPSRGLIRSARLAYGTGLLSSFLDRRKSLLGSDVNEYRRTLRKTAAEQP